LAMSKTQKEIRDVMVSVVGSGIIVWWGCGSLGAGIAVAIIWFLILMLCKMSVDHDKEVRQVSAEVHRDIFDQIVERGGKAVFNGQDWKKGCRIDPETDAVIEPGV
jgi:hypothetical protein